ncbi:MAG: glycosyltransferase [Prevotella sp.]|jgi:GT2 family glycosyltransferase|nr:glycosyltransferase [Prevotella sp.]
MGKIAAVIVTYNRLDKLKKALECYDHQTCNVDILIVVNNHSEDNTQEYLDNWQDYPAPYIKKVINLPENLGGSGGFYAGEKAALEFNVDWVLVADDDAYPDLDVIEKFRVFLMNNIANGYSAICTKVCNVNRHIVLDHRRTYKIEFGLIFKSMNCPLKLYQQDQFNLTLFSYVGTFLNAKALVKVGLCNPDLFIYCDDSEHSLRMHEFGNIICIPSMTFVHDSGQSTQNKNRNILLSWREYYGHRNYTYMLNQHHHFAALYNAVYQLLKASIKYFGYPSCFKLVYTAFLDGFGNKLGKHKLYKPGFSIKK